MLFGINFGAIGSALYCGGFDVLSAEPWPPPGILVKRLASALPCNVIEGGEVIIVLL